MRWLDGTIQLSQDSPSPCRALLRIIRGEKVRIDPLPIEAPALRKTWKKLGQTPCLEQSRLQAQ